jgi:REP element-mobilizing transposase RayT
MHPEKLYHIYNHANGMENLFREVENYHYFLRQWQKHIHPIADALAYCLMPNHFHFFIKVKNQSKLELTFGKFETFQKLEYHLSKQFSNFFSSYTQAYNKKYQRKGSLFIPNFKRKEITSDNYITSVVAYIHCNPIIHEFCNKLEDWPFGSYLAYTSERDTLLNKAYILDWFGGREQFIKFHIDYFNNKSFLASQF